MKYFAALLLSAVLFVACSGNNANDPAAMADIVVDSFKDLDVCVEKLDGQTAYVKDEMLVYVCEDEEWNIDSNGGWVNESEENSTDSDSIDDDDSERESMSSSFSSSSSVADEVLKDSFDDIILPPPCKVGVDFDCFMDERDGQTYRTVNIRGQIWMAQNLNYVYLEPIEGRDSGSFCFNDSLKYCDKLGRLYPWSVAMDSAGKWSTNGQGCGLGTPCTPTFPVRGICPEGWHLPDDREWSDLYASVYPYENSTLNAGFWLRSISGWAQGRNGEDAFGFSMYPTTFTKKGGDAAIFWEPHESSWHANDSAYMKIFYFDEMDDGIAAIDNKSKPYSVRCVQDGSKVDSSITPCKNWLVPDSLGQSMVRDTADRCEYGSLTDSRDGQIYKTVVIGSQIWMAQNLNYETSDSHCYNDDANYCAKLGRLYAAPVPTTVCPSGWHLPSVAEWARLRITASVIDSYDFLAEAYSDYYGFTILFSGTGYNGINNDNHQIFYSHEEDCTSFAVDGRLGEYKGSTFSSKKQYCAGDYIPVRCLKD